MNTLNLNVLWKKLVYMRDDDILLCAGVCSDIVHIDRCCARWMLYVPLWPLIRIFVYFTVRILDTHRYLTWIVCRMFVRDQEFFSWPPKVFGLHIECIEIPAKLNTVCIDYKSDRSMGVTLNNNNNNSKYIIWTWTILSSSRLYCQSAADFKEWPKFMKTKSLKVMDNLTFYQILI